MGVFLSGFTPVKVYPNFYEDRAIIRKEHQGKISGIYLFFNLEDVTKCYVGQSSNIAGRLNNYLNNSFLNGHKNNNSPFIQALLKYGQSGFGVIILEYVPVEQLGEREIFWIKSLKPYYNVLSGGTSGSTGFQHSQETKDFIRKMRLGTQHSEETKALIAKSLTGSSNPFFGQSHTAENLLAISNAKSTGRVYVYDSLWILLVVVSSVKMLALKVNSNFSTIASFIVSGNLFRGGWYFTNKHMFGRNVPKYDSQNSTESLDLFNKIKESVHIRKAVFLFDAKSEKFIRSYNGVQECAKDLKISHNTVKAVMSINGRVGAYILSGHRVIKSNGNRSCTS